MSGNLTEATSDNRSYYYWCGGDFSSAYTECYITSYKEINFSVSPSYGGLRLALSNN